MSRPQPDRLAVWRTFLEVHATITRLLEGELGRERDLPLSWYEVLLHLHEADGRQRMSELADGLLLHRSSLTRLIDRMEVAGLVTREVCASDGRGSLAVLTREGREVLRRAAPVHLRGVQEHFAGYLTDSDVAAMQRALSKLPGAGANRRT